MLIPGAPQDDSIRDLHARTIAGLPAVTRWVDAHTHIGQNDPDGVSATPDELLAGLDRAGHDAAVVFPMHEPEGYAEANAFVRAQCEASGGRLRPLVRVDPGADGAVDEAVRGLEAGSVGIKLHPRSDCFGLPHPVVDELAAALSARGGGILLFHAGRGIPALGPSAVEICERHANVRLILAHAGISDLGLLADHVRRLPNLCFDTAWWQVDDLLHLFATVPPGQIHYASDMPYGGGLFTSIALVRCALQVGHGPDVIAEIAGAQLERFLAGEEPLELGPAPGATVFEDDRPLAARLGSRRAVSYISMATMAAFQHGAVDEPLSLARLALHDTEDRDVALRLADDLLEVAQQEIAAAPEPGPDDPPPVPGHAPGVGALLAAGLVAGTPRAGAP